MGTVTYIGIAEMKISNDSAERLIAANLGSCLGISMYDPVSGLGGMAHCLLPSSSADPARAAENPCMYVDTGVKALLDLMLKYGAAKKHLQVVVAGGGQMHDPNGVFEIGKKNFIVFRKALWANNLLLKAEHIGGVSSQSLSLEIGTGQVVVKTQGETIPLN